jgi:hypothetical protein
VFIVSDKKVRYSDAKKKELHVFPQPESSTIPAMSICAMGWLADRVLERLRGPLVFLQCESESANRFRYPHVLLKFSAQKFASFVNF